MNETQSIHQEHCMRQCSDHTQVPLNSCDQTREDTEEVPDSVSESAGQGGNQPRPSACKPGSQHYFPLSWCEDSFRDDDSSLDHFLKETTTGKTVHPSLYQVLRRFGMDYGWPEPFYRYQSTERFDEPSKPTRKEGLGLKV